MGIIDKLFKNKKSSANPKDIDLWGFDFFKSLKEEDIGVFNTRNISDNIKTKKTNYYKILFDNVKKDKNFALYVAPTFQGVKPIPLKESVHAWVGHAEFRHDYPLYLAKAKLGHFTLHTNLELIRNNCRDIHMELDDKEGVITTKYIFHCADNEDGYDIYFVCYSGDLPKEVIDLLLKPKWVK